MYTCDESNYYIRFLNNKIDLIGDHMIVNYEKQYNTEKWICFYRHKTSK